PAPDADWYVLTRARARPAASCSGFSTIVRGIVQQFGFATIPSCSCARGPFTSGTTSGTPSSSRYADDLSTTTAAPRTACGTSSRDADVPIENKHTSRSPAESASGVASSTVIPSTDVPAERAEAKARTLRYPRSRNNCKATGPTAPVAPTTPMRASLSKLERLVQRGDSPVDVRGRDGARDLDRRRRDDGRVDARSFEGRKRLGSHSGVALHSRTDERHLPEVVARAPAHAERVERARRVAAILDGRGEHDLRPGLHDRVDVDARVRERGEEARGRDAVDVVHGLLALVHDAGDQSFLEHDLLLVNPRAGAVVERRPDVELDIVTTGDLDRAGCEHARAGRRHLEHLLVRERLELARVRNEPGIGGVDAVDVRVDLTNARTERGRKRYGRRVRAAASERRDLLLARHALEARDEHDLVPVARLVDAACAGVPESGLSLDG